MILLKYWTLYIRKASVEANYPGGIAALRSKYQLDDGFGNTQDSRLIAISTMGGAQSDGNGILADLDRYNVQWHETAGFPDGDPLPSWLRERKGTCLAPYALAG
jgi:hypothetical protein